MRELEGGRRTCRTTVNHFRGGVASIRGRVLGVYLRITRMSGEPLDRRGGCLSTERIYSVLKISGDALCQVELGRGLPFMGITNGEGIEFSGRRMVGFVGRRGRE